jgi:hypothetical protein
VTVDEKTAWYSAEMPRLVEDFEYTLRLGDTWTDPARILTIEPPLVELSVEVTAPAYAASANLSRQSPRHLAVLEGSRVALHLKSLNRKRLAEATIQFDGSDDSYKFENPLCDGWQWSLPADTPLARVTRELRYEVQVADWNGLGLESPLRGLVQLKFDRPPTATAAVVHRVVLPNAKPVIEYRLTDDYGIASAVLQAQPERQPGRPAGPPRSAGEPASGVLELAIPLEPSPLVGQHLPKRGTFSLDLAQFHLVKGDQLKLTLAVVDFRGDNAGQSSLSEPILLEISDEAGVLAAITEADERSEKRLGDVIKQQLGVGGNK